VRRDVTDTVVEDSRLSGRASVVSNITVEPLCAPLPDKWQGFKNSATIGVDDKDTILSER